MDKQGVGDSEGDCAETDLESELTAYRAAFRAVKNYDFIDANRIFILGISNGGGFAPLVPESDAEQAQVRGYISIGGWVKTWFEHMLERSEEHTSGLQSLRHLVCRLLLEKKKIKHPEI